MVAFALGMVTSQCASTQRPPFDNLDASGPPAGGDDGGNANRGAGPAPPIDLDARDDCSRIGCARPGVTYCGTIGDGCGGALACGDSPARLPLA